jgi:molybdopterin converting factor small subunit
MAKVQLRITPSFASMLGSSDYDWFIVEKEVGEGATIGSLLAELVRSHTGFGRLIFEPATGKLNQDILITLNDRLLQGTDAAQALLKDGDIVIITPAYEGG